MCSVRVVSVLSNEKGQAMLVVGRGGWGDVPPKTIHASSGPEGTVLRSEGRLLGFAQRSALPALAGSREFHLGEFHSGGIDDVAIVDLRIRTPPDFR